ncbi:MAG TPA: PIN domain-containing protein [Vicinamibacteria bacterium]|nr:PIN domain-containing protein [Vicinamibacteria bacterium]
MSGAFLDTSVLLGGLIELGPSVRAAQKVMAAVARGRVRRPITAWHCCLEFYAVATRLPEEFRLAPKDALQLLEREVLRRFGVLELDPVSRLPFLAAAAQQRVAGGRIYDAHIGEIARRAGARIVVTDNVRHFSGLAREGCRVVDSAAFAAELPR